jgi:hypothetical protein
MLYRLAISQTPIFKYVQTGPNPQATIANQFNLTMQKNRKTMCFQKG